jgi:hypothetical protein
MPLKKVGVPRYQYPKMEKEVEGHNLVENQSLLKNAI